MAALSYRRGYVSENGTVVRYRSSWACQHPIEGDGLRSMLYHHLWKRDKSGEHYLGDLRLPDTVVFEHNFPRAWYAFDPESKEIVKRPPKMLDAATIFKHFSVQPSTDCDVVAQFYYATVEVPVRASKRSGRVRLATGRGASPPLSGAKSDQWGGASTTTGSESCSDARSGRSGGTVAATTELLTYVEFFDADGLSAFLFGRAKKPDGVLQAFVVPKGATTARQNFQLRIAWSPAVVKVSRRTNKACMHDRAVPLHERAATFDGPPYLSVEMPVADETKLRLDQLCRNVVEHFAFTEKQTITRMVMHFKVDSQNRIWLLWMSSIRLASNAMNPSFLRVPLMLDMRTELYNHGTSREEARRRRQLQQEALLRCDNEMYNLSHDSEFAMQCNRSHKRQAHLLGLGEAPTCHPASLLEKGKRDNPNNPLLNLNHPLHESFVSLFGGEEALERLIVPSVEAEPADLSASLTSSHQLPDTATASRKEGSSTASGLPATEILAESEVKDDLVSMALDAWYSVYSTTLSGEPMSSSVRQVRLAPPLFHCLHDGEFQALITLLGLQKNPNAATSPSDRSFVVPVSREKGTPIRARPLAVVESDVRAFFDELFAVHGADIVHVYSSTQAQLQKRHLQEPRRPSGAVSSLVDGEENDEEFDEDYEEYSEYDEESDGNGSDADDDEDEEGGEEGEGEVDGTEGREGRHEIATPSREPRAAAQNPAR